MEVLLRQKETNMMQRKYDIEHTERAAKWGSIFFVLHSLEMLQYFCLLKLGEKASLC